MPLRFDRQTWLAPWLVIAVAGGAVATSFGVEPTTQSFWNHVLVFGLVVAIASASTRTHAVLWLVPIAPALAFPDSSLGLTLALAGLAVALTATLLGWRGPWVGSLVGTFGALALLDLDTFDTTGAASLLAFAAMIPALAVAYDSLEERGRTAVVSGIGVAGLVGFVATVAAGVGAFGLAGRVDDGSIAAERGLDAARTGEVAEAVQALGEARLILDDVQHGLDRWWMRPGRYVPIVSQHLGMAETIVRSTSGLAEIATEASTSADIQSLEVSRGTVDLEALSAMAAPLAELERAMLDTMETLERERSVWLVPPLVSEIEALRDDLADALPDTTKAADAARLVPAILGAEEPRVYLVMFANPAEARELGGLAVNFVELTVDDGGVKISAEWRFEELQRNGPVALLNADSYPPRFLASSPGKFVGNWSGIVDLPSVFRAVSDLYPAMGGREIDGLVYVDAAGLAGLMELSGPVTTITDPRTISADEIEQFLLIDQYRLFDDKADRLDALSELSALTMVQILAADIGNPSLVGRVLGPAARGGHLQFITDDEAEVAFLETMFLAGTYPEPGSTSDLLAVVHAQGRPDKLDAYLSKEIRIDTTLDLASGSVDSVVEIVLTNAVPSDIPPYVGGQLDEGPVRPASLVNLSMLSLYSPSNATSVTVDGESIPVETQRELGYQRYITFVEVPPGEPVTVRYELSGPLVLDDTNRYSLAIPNQATANADAVAVSVRRADGGMLRSREDPWMLVVETEFTSTEDVELRIDVDPGG